MPLLNHATTLGAVKIQSVFRGRKARAAANRQYGAATLIQATVRRRLAVLETRAMAQRQKVGSAIGGSVHEQSLKGETSLRDWLAANGLAGAANNNKKRGSGPTTVGGNNNNSGDADVEKQLEKRGGVTTVGQLAMLSDKEAKALAAKVFGAGKRGEGPQVGQGRAGQGRAWQGRASSLLVQCVLEAGLWVGLGWVVGRAAACVGFSWHA